MLLEMDTADVVKGCFMVVSKGKRLIQLVFLLWLQRRQVHKRLASVLNIGLKLFIFPCQRLLPRVDQFVPILSLNA